MDQDTKNKKPVVYFEYYQRPFMLLQMEHCKFAPSSIAPHPIRSRFWQLIQPGYYDHFKAQELLDSYLRSLEHELRDAIKDNSIAYWLHLYRRLSPGPIGSNSKPETIGLTRAVLEAAFQKYGTRIHCDKIGYSKDVAVENVLGGLLMHPDFACEREFVLTSSNQLVLTDFFAKDISAMYEIERLAYEIWRAGATKRGVAKGAHLIVEENSFGEARDDELEELIRIYDHRDRSTYVSATGVWYEHIAANNIRGGVIFLPTYNLARSGGDWLKSLFAVFGHDVDSRFFPNFIWVPFNIRAYRTAHLPFADSFEEKHNCKLDAVLLVVASLGLMVFESWRNSVQLMIRYWQRAYEAPVRGNLILDKIISYLPAAKESVGISDVESITNDDIKSAIDFWTLTDLEQDAIDLVYSGPHCIFLPYEDRFFIDFAWILRRLYELFHGVRHSDQNFKGQALEIAVRVNPSVLPYGECKSNSGECRQIDYACVIDDCLVIAECKAVSKSIAFDRGIISAIQYRISNVVERAINEADEKANWLLHNPQGSNYDISKYRTILPVGVSPFIEFIPSLAEKFWINKDLPRILTPCEFKALVEDAEVVRNAWNTISIRGT